MARLKRVFTDINKIAHLWYYQQQDEARNAHGNFYFDGKVIFSYGRHFPIAKHVSLPDGRAAVLFTLRGYSNTTSKHIWATQGAIPASATVINCWDVPTYGDLPALDTNLAAWKRELDPLFRSLAQARKPEIYIRSIANIKAQIETFCNAFNYPLPEELQTLLADLSKDKGIDYLKAKEEYEKAKAEREEKERLEREKKQRKDYLKEAKLWRAFKVNRMTRNSYKDGYLLRYNKEKNRIETSGGVEIPVQCVTRFYPSVLDALAGKIDLDNYEARPKLLDYVLNEANADHITIGCHELKTREYMAIAKELGLSK